MFLISELTKIGNHELNFELQTYFYVYRKFNSISDNWNIFFRLSNKYYLYLFSNSHKIFHTFLKIKQKEKKKCFAWLSWKQKTVWCKMLKKGKRKKNLRKDFEVLMISSHRLSNFINNVTNFINISKVWHG